MSAAQSAEYHDADQAEAAEAPQAQYTVNPSQIPVFLFGMPMAMIMGLVSAVLAMAYGMTPSWEVLTIALVLWGAFTAVMGGLMWIAESNE